MQPADTGKQKLRTHAICGLILITLFYAWAQESTGDTAPLAVPAFLEVAQAATISTGHEDPLLRMMREEPLEYWRQARRNYSRSVRDYTCRFTKQELLGSTMTEEQVTEVKFREGPFSVFMHFVKNPGQARRILYVKDRFTKHGVQQAVVEPEGPIARCLVNSVLRPIAGRDARRASRRTIGEFGFGRSLDLIIKYAAMTEELGILNVQFLGEGEVDGRPTYVFERRLPFDPESDIWPDGLLIVHIDQEWELPVACYAYADQEGTQLLGRYIYSDVNLNVGLHADDFEPSTYGM